MLDLAQRTLRRDLRKAPYAVSGQRRRRCGNLFRSRWLESRNGHSKGDLTSQAHERG
jgi:hypothetical protein